MTDDLAARIRTSLLESPYISEVLEVSAGTSRTGTPLVGMRVGVANVPTVADLGPVVAEFRGAAREHAGDDACVFVEIAVSPERAASVPTEAIVIRGTD